jgi:hypothetical protein
MPIRLNILIVVVTITLILYRAVDLLEKKACQ